MWQCSAVTGLGSCSASPCSRQGSPHGSPATRRGDSTREEGSHKALTLLFTNMGPVRAFEVCKQEKKTHTEEYSHIRMGFPDHLGTSHGQYFRYFCPVFLPKPLRHDEPLQKNIKVLEEIHLRAHALHSGEASEADAVTKRCSPTNKAAHSGTKTLRKPQQFLKALQNGHGYQSSSPATALNRP